MDRNRQQCSLAAPRARGVERENGRQCSNPMVSRCSGCRDGGFDCFMYSYFNYEKKESTAATECESFSAINAGVDGIDRVGGPIRV